MNVEVAWECRRIDELDDEGPPMKWGMIGVDGRVLVDGVSAGLTEGFYLLDGEPWSGAAFFDFWDMEGWTCEVYEELTEPRRDRFRQPLPRLIELDFGLLYVRTIALKPEYRGRGLGREVLGKWIGEWCDRQVGAVVIDGRPLQRREEGFDEYDEEVRDLPWESPEEDGERLARHLRGWGFHRVAGTRFMVASPRWLGFERATHLMGVEVPPDPVLEEMEEWDEEDDPGRDRGDDGDIPF